MTVGAPSIQLVSKLANTSLQPRKKKIEYTLKVVEPITRALNILSDKCVMCWMNKKNDWKDHLSDSCPRRTATNYGDPEYVLFRSNAFKLPNGWCFMCLTHQASYLFFFPLISIDRLTIERDGSSFWKASGLLMAKYCHAGYIFIYSLRYNLPFHSTYPRCNSLGSISTVVDNRSPRLQRFSLS